ncbi:MAG: hypothetical protein IKW89_02570 [Bacteroidales bacterium]|nr:hypothetical protein [Bacteroidales bacterium]
MKNNIIYNAIQNCRNILIREVQAELERRKEHSVKVDILLPDANHITTVCLYGGRPLVIYSDAYGEEADDLELFTIDEITTIIDAL